MLTALVLAAVCVGSLPVVGGVAVAIIHTNPLLAVPALGIAVLKSYHGTDRSSHPSIVASFLRSVASELRSGRSLRAAVVDCGRLDSKLGLSRVVRVAAAGRPMSEVADEMSACLGMKPVATALRVAATTGGSAVPVFESLATDAADEASLDRERRELTVQARLSIAIVGGFPVAVLAYQIISGQAIELIRSGPAGVGILAVGGGLLALGLTVVGMLMRNARR